MYKCCGIAKINAGAQDQVMADIHYNINQLQKYTAQNIPILFSESSCALAVKKEYPRIVETESSSKVADNCLEIHQYLMRLHKEGKLKTDFSRMDMKVGYHIPCHLKSLGVTSEVVDLMQLIPGIEVEVYSDECCGMGGTYGLKTKNFELSMKIGKRLFDEIISSNVNQVVTGCGACSMQIYQGTERQSLHPIKLLAMAYKGETVGTTHISPV